MTVYYFLSNENSLTVQSHIIIGLEILASFWSVNIIRLNKSSVKHELHKKIIKLLFFKYKILFFIFYKI